MTVTYTQRAAAALLPANSQELVDGAVFMACPCPCGLVSRVPPLLLKAVMSLSFWAQACSTAFNRPLQAQLDAAYASCGVTVSWGCG